MRISIILFVFTCIHYCGYSQAITVSNINVTGRFTSCNGSNTPVITASLINSPGASVVGGVFTCTNPCDSSTIRVNMSNIKWNQTPNNEWLHGLYLPANNGFTVSPVVLPAGFITYNPGCVGNCPSGSGTNGGPGFYFDNTANNSCCGTNPVNDGYPCNNYGDVSITCNSPLSLSFDIKFCNSMITSTAYVFSFHGTSDGETGCWNVNDNGLHTINFTITTNACTIVPIAPVASSPIRTCVGNVENYTSTLSGTCAANTLSWWDAPVGGTIVGTGSPFSYDPAGSACPAGTTLYATCCTGNSTSCISRVPITIPGNCNPLFISAISSINSTCLLLGSITSINVQNAVGTITYTLNPSGASNTTGIFTGLNQPSYTCTVTDATGCTASSVVLITQVSTIAFDTLSMTGVTCASPNIGSLSVSTTGGSGIITYSISPSATQNPVGTFTGLSAQVYTVIATDANACSVSTIITITSSALPTWDSVTTSPTSCVSATGSIQCNAIGGSGNFTYTILPSGTSNATGIFSSLINGNYTITAMDAAGCTVSTIAVVTLPTPIIFTQINSDSTTCFGSNDGSISVVTSGGMGTISYTLLPGNIFSNNGNFTNLSSGIYTIVAIDSYGCTSSTIVNVHQPNSITFTSTNIVAPLCHTSLDGSISIAAIGGIGIITYNLNPGNITNTNGSFNGLGSGVYTITASDMHNCTSTTIVNMIAPNSILISSMNVVNNICNGGSIGSIQINATGGTGLITYLLMPNNVSNTTGLFINLSANNYTVTASDMNGCGISTVVVITAPNALSISLSATSILCHGGTSTITATGLGGTGLYQFQLNTNPFQNGNIFANQTAGMYTITIKDANNCTATSSIIITEPNVLSVNLSATNILCHGGTSTITATGLGGTGLYQYQLNANAFQNGNVFTNLSAGIYSVTIKDANNCTATSSINITEPNVLSVSLSASAILCNGATSTITATGNGSTTNYQYQLNAGPFQNGNTFTNQTAGTYTVTIKDANNCTATSSITITQPTSLLVSSLTSTIPSCVPGNDATITITASGGIPAYTYSIGGAFQSNPIFTGIGTGTYTITVKDANACSVTSTIAVVTPNTPTFGIPIITNVNCFGGNNASIQVSANGGTGSITYTILPINQTNATGLFTNLSANTYTINATDANACSTNTQIIITQPNAVAVTLSATSILCHSGTSTITATGLGGTGLYQYQLNANPFQSGNVFPNLSAGVYTITIKDANNCTATSSINIIEPNVLTVNLSASTILCNVGTSTITATGNGGTTNYQYQLNAGPFQSGNTFPNQTAGTYTVTIKDANNCTASSSFNITEPSPLLISNVSSTIPSCVPGNDAVLTITASGGIPAYTYSIGGTFQSSPIFSGIGTGTYTITVKDANACSVTSTIAVVTPNAPTFGIPIITNVNCFGGNNASIQVSANGGTGAITYTILPINQTNATGLFINLSANTYTINATDANACSTNTQIIITQPNAVAVTLSATSILCHGGTSTITATGLGGTGLYQYQLNANAFQNGNVFTNLSAGIYSVTIKDANNCTATSSINITEPNVLSVSLSASAILCNGATSTITATGNGGTTNYQYQLNAGPFQNGNTFTNQTAGTYTVTIQDANNCTATSSINITEPAPLLISNVSSTIPSCVPGNDAVITITASGGIPAYTYSIGVAFQNSPIFNGIGTGTYTITVQDANACSVTSTIAVVTPNAPSITSVLLTSISCFPGADGTATISAIGGSGAYTFSMDGINFQSSPIFNGLLLGNYTVLVKDANGCTGSSIITTTIQASPNITAIALVAASCTPGCDGSASITASGGSSSIFTYSLDNITFQSSSLFTNLCSNIYTVIVKDANGCTASSIFNMLTSNGPTINSSSHINVSCFGGNNGNLAVTATGGIGNLLYTIQPNGQSNANGIFSNLIANNYTLTVSDSNGCSVNTTIAITEPNALQFTNLIISAVTCYGANNGSINFSTQGGTPNIIYSINPAGLFTPPNLYTNLVGNIIYTILATDANGCTQTTTAFIAEPLPIIIDTFSAIQVTCNGLANGAIFLQAINGTGSLNYTLLPLNINSTTGQFSGLLANTYTVVVSDANNCSISTIVNITEPSPILLNNINGVNISCNNNNDGSIQLNCSGGNGVLQYNLQPGNIVNGSGIFTGLSANNYTITVSDVIGCNYITSVTISNPPVLQFASVVHTTILCNGASNASISAVAIGGTGSNYTYSITPQNASNNNGLFTGLLANNFTVTATDVNNCSITTTVNITQTLPLIGNILNTQNESCFNAQDGQISVNATGGTAPYTYVLSPSGISNVTGIFTNLSANNYTILITDSNLCTTTIGVIPITSPPAIVWNNITHQNITCYGQNTGGIQVLASGGMGSINYVIQPAIGTQTTTGNFTNLVAGIYTIIATDAITCSQSTVVQITQNPEIQIIQVGIQEPICYRDGNGVIDILANGGTGFLNYQINLNSPQLNGHFVNLQAGMYTISIHDSLGCTKDTVLEITQPEPIHALSLNIYPILCEGINDGKIIVVGAGGRGNYVYSLKPGFGINSSGVFNNLKVGTYTLTIKDSAGCIFDTTVSMTSEFIPFSSSFIKQDLSCFGKGNEGWAEVQVQGGIVPFTYLWNSNPPQNTQRATDLFFGKYIVEITDAHGCSIHDTVTIDPGPCCDEVFVPNAFSPNGDGVNDVFKITTSAGIDLIRFEVFDRWGERIWSTADFRNGWDGNYRNQQAQVGTYYYLFWYNCLTDGKKHMKKGDLILIR